MITRAKKMNSPFEGSSKSTECTWFESALLHHLVTLRVPRVMGNLRMTGALRIKGIPRKIGI